VVGQRKAGGQPGLDSGRQTQGREERQRGTEIKVTLISTDTGKEIACYIFASNNNKTIMKC
jgi:selenocysteine-specific translation elongation factor